MAPTSRTTAGPRDSFDSANALRVSPDSSRVYVTGFSFGVGTSRDYATVAYDAAASPELPVFVPWDLRVRPDLAISSDRVGVSANVTNVGTSALAVTEGVTCLDETARVDGPVDVRVGAGLVSIGATVTGEVSAVDAAVVALRDSRFTGPITVTGTTGGLVLSGNRITGRVPLDGNATDGLPLVVAGNQIVGRLACVGNTPRPVNRGLPNEATGRATGQCADL